MNKSNGIVQAKEEYTKELINILTEPMCAKFLCIYENIIASTKNKRELIINFQKALREIPLWNQGLIDTEVSQIRAKCEFLDDLVAAIFVTNVKILSSVKMGKDKKKIQITMPKTDQFIHKNYINAAQTLYNNPYIFSSQYESQKRRAEIILHVQNSIENTIRTNLPFRNILQNYLGNAVDESESESESESSEAEDKTNELENDSLQDEMAQSNEDNTESLAENHDEQNIEPQKEGFFDRPIEQQLPSEFLEKTVPIANPPQNMHMQESQMQEDTTPQSTPQSTPQPVPGLPMLFPDASGP
tara:strand:- start:5800 stop:6702 length:903 start_codon:yes stop_codon:yes gene_type:complete